MFYLNVIQSLKGAILVFIIATMLCLISPIKTFAQSGVLLGGAAGEGPIRLAEGADCQSCEYVTNFLFGNWISDVRLVRAHSGLQELKFDFVFSIDNLTGFSGRNSQCGISSYSIGDFDVSKRHNSYQFKVVLKLRGPETKEDYRKSFNINITIGPDEQRGIPTNITATDQWTFGPGENLTHLYKLLRDNASLSEIRDSYNLQVDSWKLISINYPNLKDYDIALSELLSERSDKVKHDELVRQAQQAQKEGHYKASAEIYEKALSYYKSDDTRARLDNVNNYLSQRENNNVSSYTENSTKYDKGSIREGRETDIDSNSSEIAQHNSSREPESEHHRKYDEDPNNLLIEKADSIRKDAADLMEETPDELDSGAEMLAVGTAGFVGEMWNQGLLVGVGIYSGGPATNENQSLWSAVIWKPTLFKGEFIVDAGSLLNPEEFDPSDFDPVIEYGMGATFMLGLEIWDWMGIYGENKNLRGAIPYPSIGVGGHFISGSDLEESVADGFYPSAGLGINWGNSSAGISISLEAHKFFGIDPGNLDRYDDPNWTFRDDIILQFGFGIGTKLFE